MKYQVNDRVDGPQVFDTEQEAQAALPVAKAKFLDREGYRFSYAIIQTNGSDTVWRNPIESDPEDGDYRVFVHTTGQYESYAKRSEAETRVSQLKDELLAFVQLDKVYEYVPPPAAPTTIPTAVL